MFALYAFRRSSVVIDSVTAATVRPKNFTSGPIHSASRAAR